MMNILEWPILKYYLMALRKYAVFSGRSRRAEYWYFFLVNFIIAAIFGRVNDAMGGTPWYEFHDFIIFPLIDLEIVSILSADNFRFSLVALDSANGLSHSTSFSTFNILQSITSSITLNIFSNIYDLYLELFGAYIPITLNILSNIYGLYYLATIIPTIAVTVRRLHDTDHSAWWLLFILLPFIGWLVLFIFMVSDGTPMENRYGPDPKEKPRKPRTRKARARKSQTRKSKAEPEQSS